MAEVVWAGHCVCGACTWSTAETDAYAHMCYCDHCQRSTGAERSLHLMLEKRQLKIDGPTKSYTTESQHNDVDKPGVNPDGSTKKYKYTLVFCFVCGSQLAHEDGWHHDRLAMKVGTLSEKWRQIVLMNLKDPLPVISHVFAMNREIALTSITVTQMRLDELKSITHDFPIGFEEKDLMDSKKLKKALYAKYPYPD